jgi:hypothetical protein
MDHSQNSHAEGLAFGSFFKIIHGEDMVSFYYRESHYEENSSKALVTALGYSTFDFRLTGFIDRWINAGIGDEFFI